MQIIDSTPAALSSNLQMYLRNGDVFFDIETTGLSWRTSHLYLIGALFFDPADFDLDMAMHVIVETARGIEMGTVLNNSASGTETVGDRRGS